MNDEKKISNYVASLKKIRIHLNKLKYSQDPDLKKEEFEANKDMAFTALKSFDTLNKQFYKSLISLSTMLGQPGKSITRFLELAKKNGSSPIQSRLIAEDHFSHLRKLQEGLQTHYDEGEDYQCNNVQRT